jgi:hypothetical protein
VKYLVIKIKAEIPIDPKLYPDGWTEEQMIEAEKENYHEYILDYITDEDIQVFDTED